MYRFANQRQTNHSRYENFHHPVATPTPRRLPFDLQAFNQQTLKPLNLKLLSFQNDFKVVERLCETCQAHPCKRTQQTELFELDGWPDKPWTLMYKAHITRDYTRGDYYVLEKKGKIIAGAGFYSYMDAIPVIGPRPFTVLMSRFYTTPEHRVQWLGSHILRAQLEAMRTFQGVITFNDINKPLYGKIARLEPKADLDPYIEWPRVWRSFTALGNLHINATDQWCLVTDKEQHNLP